MSELQTLTNIGTSDTGDGGGTVGIGNSAWSISMDLNRLKRMNSAGLPIRIVLCSKLTVGYSLKKSAVEISVDYWYKKITLALREYLVTHLLMAKWLSINWIYDKKKRWRIVICNSLRK